MKWYTCLNEESLSAYIDHLRVAIASAIDVGRLEAHVLYDGDPNKLITQVGRRDFVVHTCRTPLYDAIMATPDVPGWSRQTAQGALLRLEIPLVETSDAFVLYTDCDVLFTRRVDLTAFTPQFLAAAPAHNPFDWDQLCSGVLLINTTALRSEHDQLMELSRQNLGVPHFYDQEVLNLHFKGRWDRLPLEAHWKPYWGPNPCASIVHFHGPKAPAVKQLLLKGQTSTAFGGIFEFLYNHSPDGYLYYLRLYDQHTPAARPLDRFRLALITATTKGLLKIRHRNRKPLPRPLRAPLSEPSLEAPTNDTYDEDSYLLINLDVAFAVFEGTIPSGRFHFEHIGQSEGRLQRIPEDEIVTSANFDERAYLARNPDVVSMMSAKRYPSVRTHFETTGRREGRRQRQLLCNPQSVDTR